MKDIKEMLSPMGAEVSIIPVMQGDSMMKVNEAELPDSLPVLALRNAVLFPGTVYPITIGREKSIRLIQDSEKNNTYIGAVPQLDVTVEDPKKEDLYGYGTVAKIIKTLEMPDGTLTAILQGFKRFELETIVEYDPYMLGRVHYLNDIVPEVNDNNIKMIVESLKEKSTTILKFSSFAPKEAAMALKSIDNFEFLVNFIATTIEVENFFEKVELLQYADLKTRAMKLLAVLDTQIELLKIKQDINQKVKSEIDQQQREYYLNNQLRTIQEELGMDDSEDFDRFRKRAEELGMEVREFVSSGRGGDIDRYRELADAFRQEGAGVTGAFFCADDIMLGVCNELRAGGTPVDELDSIGCNADEVLLRYLSPRPATIDIKMAQVGEVAVLHLLRRINSERNGYSSEIFIKPELVKGDR